MAPALMAAMLLTNTEKLSTETSAITLALQTGSYIGTALA